MFALRAIVLSLIAVLSAAAFASATSISVPRQIQSPAGGTIVAPAPGTSIVSGTDYDFSFGAANYCEDGYLTFTVYLLADLDPQFSDLNAEGQFTDYLFNYGNFTIAEFGESWPSIRGNEKEVHAWGI